MGNPIHPGTPIEQALNLAHAAANGQVSEGRTEWVDIVTEADRQWRMINSGTTVTKDRMELLQRAVELLAGLLYTTSRDNDEPAGRMYHEARGLLPPLLGINESEADDYIEHMHKQHGLQLELDGVMAEPSNGCWFLTDVHDGHSISLTIEEIERLYHHTRNA